MKRKDISMSNTVSGGMLSIYVSYLVFFYSEFLPRVLGPEYVKIFGLALQREGYSKVYNDRCSPDIYNSFATAAFRFGHSLIKPMLNLVPSKRRKDSDEIRLRNHFNNPDVVFR